MGNYNPKLPGIPEALTNLEITSVWSYHMTLRREVSGFFRSKN